MEEFLITRKFNVKGRPYPGGKISDMYLYLIPLLNKRPNYIACWYK